jgi:hypothetical protein
MGNKEARNYMGSSLSSVMTVHVGLFLLMMALRDGKFNSAVHALSWPIS